ncbi:hypothetical protein FRC07_003842 [Ceratobasidium sp. 392]|nr:hypothetical protein FRC07_003842 [Ceratobasidium sp. 392]
MLDTTILQPPSGSALCLAVLQRTLSYRDNFEREIILGESSIKVLKDVITRTDGRIDALTTTLQLIHMEHCWYQIEVFDAAARHVAKVEPLLQVKTPANVDKDVVYGPDLKITVQPENVLLAFLTLDKRKGALADGFFPADADKTFTKYALYQQAETLGHEPCCDRMNQSRYGLVALLHLTWSFYERGAYRQEVPLPFLDLLELAAKGPNDIEKYATWMLKKGFQCVNVQHPRLTHA